MSDEAVTGAAAVEADVPVPEVTPGFGAALARARESRGLSVVDIAARLRLHPRQIAALEEERLDALPTAPFVRGFVRNYAKELHLDPAPLLAALEGRMPATEPKTDAVTGAGLAPTEVRHAGVERTSRIAVIGGSLLLLVVLGLIGWVASQRPQAVKPATTSAAVAGSAQSDGAIEQPTPAPASAAPATAATEPVRPVAAPSAATATSTSAAPAATPPAPAAAPGSGLRIIVGERPSWVEITQADGRVLLTGLQEPGTERRIGSVQPPLQLVIGNASSVTLEYRGRTVDLARHVRANDLARLTLE